MNFPVPTHLKDIFRIDEKNSDESNLSVTIVCECGCTYFIICHNEDREYDDAVPYSEQPGLKVIAECTSCGKRHLIFDEATQGYNGFVCGDFVTASDDTLAQLKCTQCDASAFALNVDIEAEDKEQFIEECVNEYPDKFSPDDHINAFGWITLKPKCKKCCCEYEWIDLELS